MLNLFDTTAELQILDGIELSDKGTQQVSEFKEFAKPLMEALSRGQVAKQELANYYLDRVDEYTDGAKKYLELFMAQVDISAGFLSKVKSARKYIDSHTHNPTLQQYLMEHPVGTQYLLSRAPQEEVLKAANSGLHFTKREVEALIAEQKIDKPVPEPEASEFQLRLKRQQEMVESKEYPLIRETGAAEVLMTSTRKNRAAAVAQDIHGMKYRDSNMDKIIDILIAVLADYKTKPYYQPKTLTGQEVGK